MVAPSPPASAFQKLLAHFSVESVHFLSTAELIFALWYTSFALAKLNFVLSDVTFYKVRHLGTPTSAAAVLPCLLCLVLLSLFSSLSQTAEEQFVRNSNAAVRSIVLDQLV